MPRILLIMGPFAWPLLLIALANIGLVIWRASQLTAGSPRPGPAVEAGINAILFWGVVALLLGYLGQYSGLYRSLTEAARRGVISPGLVAMGVAESISTTIFGLTILIVSSIAWFLLRSRYQKLSRAADQSGSRVAPAAA